jgi:hypothetical protein
LLPVPAARHCFTNPCPHIGYTLSQAGKSHSCPI